MARPGKPLWRRVRWGNVGGLCALLAALATLASARGGERRPPTGEPPAGTEAPGPARHGPHARGRSDAHWAERGDAVRPHGGRGVERRRAARPGSRGRRVAKGAPSRRRRADATNRHRQVVPRGWRARSVVAGPRQGGPPASGSAPAPPRPPNGEFTPDPGPWR